MNWFFRTFLDQLLNCFCTHVKLKMKLRKSSPFWVPRFFLLPFRKGPFRVFVIKLLASKIENFLKKWSLTIELRLLGRILGESTLVMDCCTPYELFVLTMVKQKCSEFFMINVYMKTVFRVTLKFNWNENFKLFIFPTTAELGRGTLD